MGVAVKLFKGTNPQFSTDKQPPTASAGVELGERPYSNVSDCICMLPGFLWSNLFPTQTVEPESKHL